MFQTRDYSIFVPSPNAERSFRLIRWFDYAIRGLIALLVVLCIWNLYQLAQLRTIENQDLAAVSDIRDDLSTRLVWLVTLITAGVVLLREWHAGITTMGLLIPGTILLGLVLVPAVSTEIQPPLQQQTLRLVMAECPPKAIVNNELSSIGRCQPRALNEENVLLAVSNPADETFTTIEAVSVGQNTVTYTMEGRGTYTVYFMFGFADMDTCERSTILPRGQPFGSVKHQCILHNSAAWQVVPHTTSGTKPGGIHLIQVTVP